MTWGGEDTSNLNTPEVIFKRSESNRRNHGGVLSFNTPESHRKSIESNRKNHGGILSFNTPESWINRAKIGNGDVMWQCHDSISRLNNENSKLINIINSRVKVIKSKNLPLTPYNYYHAIELTNNHNNKTRLHIISVTEHMYSDSPIQLNDMWDPSWTNLFNWFDDENNWKLVESGILD
jgi:hypothetical protein